ncbi:MAG TPA: EAL domain-containing protein [Thermoanaerobaculia bacterium]|nr:EAL domain-containing protein [Thermoanaerobaculia bacterium]
MKLDKGVSWLRRFKKNRISGQSSSRWLLLLAVVIAIGAALVVANFHRLADGRRQNQLRLAQIEQLSEQLRMIELGSSGKTQPAEGGAESALNAAVAKLMAADPMGDAAVNVSEAASSYAANVDEHFRLLRAGRTAEAARWNDERSRPSYVLVHQAVLQASTFYSAQADRALRRANVGSTLAIAFQALLIGLLVFVAERGRRANELRFSEERARKDAQFRSMIQNSSDVIAILDASGEFRFVSPSIRRVLGYEPETRLGRPAFASLHPEDISRAQEAMSRVLSDPDATHLEELRALHADGSWRWIEISATNLLSDSNVQGIVLNYRDVTERKALQDQLRHQALHDSLTGLANRALFHNLLGHALAAAKRRKSQVAVFFLDLDNFKQINDGLGHEAGDQLLIQVAERLRSCVRMEDTPARLGGDEFAVLAEGMGRRAASEFAKRLLAALQRPFQLAGEQVAVGASVGIAFAALGETSPEDLLRNADVAMYVAKNSGKGRFEIFESGMYRQVKEQLDLELDFRYALDKEQFELHYQPIMVLETGELIGVEALVRWRDVANRRLLMPGEFLPLAERTGLILPLGRWIIENACRQVHEWHTRFPETAPMLLSVNLSERQFLDPELVETVQQALSASGLSGDHLILEISEEVLLQNLEVSGDRLRGLKRLGIRLAIDDFGGGYSALRQLRRLPVDVVKIHKSFVDNVTMSPADSELTHSLIDLAKRLKLQTLAEGIELDRQATALGRMGCELGQGYYLARPLDVPGFESLLGSLGSGDWREAPDSEPPAKGVAS